jgi:phosphomannomutase
MEDRILEDILRSAVRRGDLSEPAADHLRLWMTDPRYAEYAGEIETLLGANRWQELDDAFWTVIPFGTGGRRGRMYPLGPNAINDRTIGESAQGLADYVLSLGLPAESLSCAIAYDTRNNSRRFAELCASIMVASGFRVFFLDGYRSTPELSFLVRYKQCACGIMVTASHNPPSDNAVKIYWSTGGQVLPPHDREIIERVMNVGEIRRRDFQQAVADGQVVLCTAEVDSAFHNAVIRHCFAGPRELKVLYSPLHGVGESAVVPVLHADGFVDVEVYEPHRQPDGNFPNVPGHVSNPENPGIFSDLISHAQATGADLVLATDPDCDRMGAAAPRYRDRAKPWGTFTGNQLAAMLTDYVCGQRRAAVRLTDKHFLVTTLVTTPLIRRIGDYYGVASRDNVHVGFKWIAQQIDEGGPELFVFGVEESHGFLIGDYVRDKDGPAACMLMAELAAQVKANGKTLHDHLESLYWQHGYHGERQINVAMSGSAGMARMRALMAALRENPPPTLGGLAVRQVRDYSAGLTRLAAGGTATLEAPRGDLIALDLAEPGNFVAVRPSGTEPKVKFYLFSYVPAEQLHSLDATRSEMDDRLDRIEADLQAFVAGITAG